MRNACALLVTPGRRQGLLYYDNDRQAPLLLCGKTDGYFAYWLTCARPYKSKRLNVYVDGSHEYIAQ